MAIGELRVGSDRIIQTSEGKFRGKLTPYISWKPDDTKAVFFLTSIEEIPKVIFHQFVRKFIEDEEGNSREIWMSFMCRKDPAWMSESQGECVLCDQIGHASTEKFVALAVEVEPKLNGKKVTGVDVKYRVGKNENGEEVELPNVGLIIQSSRNFFSTLVALDQKRDINDISFEITRQGESLDTKYVFWPIEYKPNLKGLDIPTLKDVLEAMGSSERYERDLQGVLAEDQTSFGDRSKKKPSSKTENLGDVFSELKAQLEKSQLETY